MLSYLLLVLLLTSLLLLAIWGYKMAVNLSPVGGVAGQFFDNNGDPLAGGKLFTYAAGTTTPQVTFTSSSGGTPNSNPIILNAGGRVPSEIWLTDGLVYKFVLYSSTDQLIGSWDNIIGINSNFVNFVTSEEVQIATAGQTVFTLTTMQYQPGLNNLVVYVDGVNQVEGGSYSFVETNSTTVTFTAGLHLGAVVKFVSAETLTTVGSNANVIAYEPAGVGAVVTTVQTKLRETVSVKDFGAVGDGVTDDTVAIQAAVTYSIQNDRQLFVPAGIYIVKQIRNLSVDNPNSVANCFGVFFSAASVLQINDNHSLENVYIRNFAKGIYVTGRMILHTHTNVETDGCVVGMQIDGDPAAYAVNLNTFIMCRWGFSKQEGVKITGYNIANKFISCNVEQSNTDQVAGVAGMYVEDAEGLFLDNPYFEMNGGSVAVDAVNPLNNSIGLYLTGDRCFNLRVTNGWMVQSGTIIAVNVSQGIIGGEISGIRFASLTNGFDVYVGDKLNSFNAPPMIIDSNNYWSGSGKLSVKTDGAGVTSATVRQTATCQYVTNATTLDLRGCSKFVVNRAAGFNLTDITNRIPGMEMKIYNAGSGTVTIDASLMRSGLASSILPDTSKSYLVLGFPSIGKFVEI
jgi:hypothetical protein